MNSRVSHKFIETAVGRIMIVLPYIGTVCYVLELFNLLMHRFAKIESILTCHPISPESLPRTHKSYRENIYPIYHGSVYQHVENNQLPNDHGEFLRLQQQLELQQNKRNFDLHNKEEI